MSIRGGVVLFNSSMIGSTAQIAGTLTGGGLETTWPGGRSQIVICASQYGTTVNVQVQGPAPQANWIPICSSFVADQIFNFDAPPGRYRIVGAGSSIALSAVLLGTTYY